MINREMKAARARKGINQIQLAIAVGKQQSWVSNVEIGRMLPTRKEAKAISAILGVKLQQLFSVFA